MNAHMDASTEWGKVANSVCGKLIRICGVFNVARSIYYEYVLSIMKRLFANPSNLFIEAA